MGIESVRVQFSGGAANATPALSTGGVISSVDVKSQSAAMTAITGITITDAVGNPVGSGTFVFNPIAVTATWTPPGAVAGSPVTFVGDGVYAVRGAGPDAGYLIVTVVQASLPPSGTFSNSVVIADLLDAMLPQVDKDTAYAGVTQYFLYYIKNTGAASVKAVSATLPADLTQPDALSIATASALNTTELQTDAAGKTYSNAAVTIGDMATTDYMGLWIKRVVPVGTITPVPARPFTITINALT